MGGAAEGDAQRPNPEVLEQAQRRRFSAAYKRSILEEADGCKELGQIGELLRREGLYSSQLSTWRRQREEGLLMGLNPKTRGRKMAEKSPCDGRIRTLEKENARLRQQLQQAQTIIDVQKKLSELLGAPLSSALTTGNA